MVEHWYTIVTIPSTLDDFHHCADDFYQALTAAQLEQAQLELGGNHLRHNIIIEIQFMSILTSNLGKLS